MKKSNNTTITTLSLLGVLFIGLKLTHYINWSWWYVFLPFYGGLLLLLIILALLYLHQYIKFKKYTKSVKKNKPIEPIEPARQSKFMQRLNEAERIAAERKANNP